MTQRERVLTGAVAGVVGLFVVYQVGYWGIYGPYRTMKENIRATAARKVELGAKLTKERKTTDEWLARTGRTLAVDVPAAKRSFVSDVQQLLDRAGLSSDVRIAPGAELPQKKTGFVELSVTVNVDGTLEGLVNFMREFYKRPYLSRIRNLTITPQELPFARKTGATDSNATASATSAARKRGGAARGGASPAAGGGHTAGRDVRLKISLTALALVLPKMPGAEHNPLGPNAEEWPTAQRLSRELESYAALAAIDLFNKWEPPPAVVVHPPQVEPKPVEPVIAAKPEPPPPDPRPNAPHQELIGVVSMNNQRIAYVRDKRNLEQPPTTHTQSEALDDGILVLIHPEGLVVRVERESRDGQPPTTTDWFYARGKTFSERVPLDPTQHPEVAREVELAMRL